MTLLAHHTPLLQLELFSSSIQDIGEEAPNLLDTSSASVEKLGGTVHNKKKNWVSEMEKSFMVSKEQNIFVHFSSLDSTNFLDIFQLAS